ncbi:hypothetical protein AX15_001874 [Amanita polypyramis BW_CC]|nr:hypothetical protein AX15_001874 [Amanita polypyramis BW_CC]
MRTTYLWRCCVDGMLLGRIQALICCRKLCFTIYDIPTRQSEMEERDLSSVFPNTKDDPPAPNHSQLRPVIHLMLNCRSLSHWTTSSPAELNSWYGIHARTEIIKPGINTTVDKVTFFLCGNREGWTRIDCAQVVGSMQN